jgi:hypothetical protein
MSLNQATIHQEAFAFAKAMMGETTPGLVKLTIDTLPCKCLKSYLELTKIKIKTDAKGSKSYIKINPLRVCPFFTIHVFYQL